MCIYGISMLRVDAKMFRCKIESCALEIKWNKSFSFDENKKKLFFPVKTQCKDFSCDFESCELRKLNQVPREGEETNRNCNAIVNN